MWHAVWHSRCTSRRRLGALGTVVWTTLLSAACVARSDWEVLLVSDSTAGDDSTVPRSTIDSIVERLEPIGDLSRFVIEDMGPDEEDQFFAVLEEA
jgi:hypothetical protein